MTENLGATPPGEGVALSPFENEVLDALSAINVTLMRLYDAQLALLNATNPEAADYIVDHHDKGNIISAPPIVNDDPFIVYREAVEKPQNSP